MALSNFPIRTLRAEVAHFRSGAEKVCFMVQYYYIGQLHDFEILEKKLYLSDMRCRAPGTKLCLWPTSVVKNGDRKEMIQITH